MLRRSAGTTRPTLLGRVREWGDGPAWEEFFRVYEPCLRGWCRVPGLGEEEADEAVQRAWIALAERLRTFRYDPGRSFRGWLRRFCRSRVVDMLRERDPARVAALRDDLPAPADSEPEVDDICDGGSVRPRLVEIAAEAQGAGREQVEGETWRAFWLVEIEGRTIREAADLLGKSYAATFAAHKRVKGRLRDEGHRLLGGAPA
jgi:RNA polymerase sigma-70 factor (ECF subfamily)